VKLRGFSWPPDHPAGRVIDIPAMRVSVFHPVSGCGKVRLCTAFGLMQLYLSRTEKQGSRLLR